MSASARARASQKYKSRLSLERGGYGPHTGTPMSGAERARRFRERRKADAARNFSAATNIASTSNTGIPVLMDVTNEQTAANLASTSTTGIPVLMDVTNEQTIDISIGSATELSSQCVCCLRVYRQSSRKLGRRDCTFRFQDYSIKTYRHYGKRGASKLQKYIHWCEMHHNRRNEHDWMRCAT
ncbi:uncharacterized protein TNCV_3095441 [Trichonephila clavipes]|uniref:Uncharacterized protein n=1 Tax=Trichonephila clavipes TaxID=2585209 RepID=A0A8X7BLA5_TRICX|nr:uncharacterized protein TNCV_3095441 [Trichonephila clavipes]